MEIATSSAAVPNTTQTQKGRGCLEGITSQKGRGGLGGEGTVAPQESKTIWHLLSNRWNSAITEYALSTARALTQQGYRCIFSPLAYSLAEKRARGYGLELESFPDFSALRLWQTWRKAHTFKDPLVVFTYGGPETFLTKILPKTIPIIRFIGQDIDKPEKFHSSWAYSHIQKLLLPNELLLNKLKAPVGVQDPKELHKVFLGVDEELYHYETQPSPLPEDFDLPQFAQRPKLVLLGRLDPVKGHEQCLQIFTQALTLWRSKARPGKDPLLCIVGEEANIKIPEIEALITKYELAEDVCFYPKRLQSIRSLLNQAHLGLITSLGSEQICRVAHEFLLCGAPILVSGVGATEEALIQSSFGSSYRGQNVEEAAQTLCVALEKSLQEGPRERELRAKEASLLFSLQSMGKQLSRLT